MTQMKLVYTDFKISNSQTFPSPPPEGLKCFIKKKSPKGVGLNFLLKPNDTYRMDVKRTS